MSRWGKTLQMNRREAFLWMREALFAAGSKEAEVEANHALSAVEDISLSDLILYGDVEISEQSMRRLQEAVLRRAKNEPLAYILGERYFMGLRFCVTPMVLIPRQETELLCEEALRIIKNEKVKTVLDMCTGSGCIGISLAHYAGVGITLADIDENALHLAGKNASMHHVQAKLIQTDLFANIADTYDMIVCNPPYITQTDYENLAADVQQYEPRKALYAGVDGLSFYRRIATKAHAFLNKDGYLLLEIGYDQSETVPQLLQQNHFIIEEVKKDYAGIYRMIIARKN